MRQQKNNIIKFIFKKKKIIFIKKKIILNNLYTYNLLIHYNL